MTVNNIEVTVNTCTCTEVFTVITTTDQSGGIYNSYNTGKVARDLWLQYWTKLVSLGSIQRGHSHYKVGLGVQ